MDERACVNTDKEIWRKVKDDYYSPRIYVTKQNGITFCVGGNCVTKSIEDWFALATPTFSGGGSEKEVAKIIREFKIGLDGKRYEDDFPDKLAHAIAIKLRREKGYPVCFHCGNPHSCAIEGCGVVKKESTEQKENLDINLLKANLEISSNMFGKPIPAEKKEEIHRFDKVIRKMLDECKLQDKKSATLTMENVGKFENCNIIIKVITTEQKEDCKFCNGTGKRIAHPFVGETCPLCKGTGKPILAG